MTSVDQFTPTIRIDRSAVHDLTAIPLEVAQDGTLTLDARGLFIYIASFCDPVTFEQMLADTTDGPRTTRRALDELVERGLIAVVQGE